MKKKISTGGNSAGAWEPTPEQASRLLGFSRNGEHYGNNTKQIKKEFAGKFIAIHDEDIVLSKDEPKDLLGELKARFGEEKLSEIYITYVPREQEVRIA